MTSETPGPGEGDLRAEVTGDTAFWRDSAYAMEQARDHFRAERDAAVEQRTLAEQKVARAWDEGYDAAHLMAYRYWHVDSWEDEPENPYRAALADPEADRGGTT